VTALELIQALATEPPQPVYFLFGEERLFVIEIVDALIRKLITPDNRDFNLERFDAAQSAPGDWVGAARTLSFLGGYKLVVVEGLDAAEWEDPAVQTLLDYLGDPSPDACLVLTSQTADRKRKLFKALTALSGAVECAAPKEAALVPWLRQRAGAAGYTLTAAAAQKMMDRVGPRPGLLAMELDKVLTYSGRALTVSEDAVAEVVGDIKLEDGFALSRALREKNAQRALALLRNQLDHGEAPIKILGTVAWQFRMLWEARHHQAKRVPPARMASLMGQKPYSVEQALRYARNFKEDELRAAFRALYRADRDLKTTGKDPDGVMESLVLSLCSARGAQGVNLPRQA